MNKKISAALILAVLVSIALMVRILSVESLFSHGDAAMLPSLVMANKGIYWVMYYSYGIITPLISEFFVNTLIFLGVPVTEFWWAFPFALVGALTVVIVYLLLNEITNYKTALFAAAIIALFPPHIEESVTTYGYEAVNLFLALFSVYLFILFLKYRNKKIKFTLALIFSFYIISHALFLFIFLILVWTAVIFIKKRNRLSFKAELKEIFLNKTFFFPGLSALLVVTLALEFMREQWWLNFGVVSSFGAYHLQTMLGHYLMRYQSLYDLPLKAAGMENLLDVASGWFLIMMIFSIPFGIKDVMRFSERSIFFVWGMLYLIPFCLMEIFFSMGKSGYSGFGSVPMIIYFILILEPVRYSNSQKGKYTLRALSNILKCFLLFFLLFICCYETFDLDLKKIAGSPGKTFYDFLEQDYEDRGIKASGYYIRKYVDQDSVVFWYEGTKMDVVKRRDDQEEDDEWTGFTDSLAWYYFGRESRFVYFQPVTFQGSHVIVAWAKHKEYVDSFSDFEVKASIYDMKKGFKKVLLLIYARKELDLPKISMDIAEFNSLYDKNCSFKGRPAKEEKRGIMVIFNSTSIALLGGV